MRAASIRLSALALLLAGAWTAYTQQTKQAPPPMTLVKLYDDLYVLENNGAGNVAIYTTDEGVILVDDKFDQNYDEIMANVKKVSDKPVKYVMSTHHHGDHTGSSAKFLPIAEIIAHKNNRENLVKAKQPGAPRVVFSDETSVFLGGKEVRARWFGRGHTNGDAVVFFPAHRTIHTGDLMAGTSILVDYANGGSAKDWTGTLDNILKNDFDTVIPGHGDVHKRADLETYRGNVAKLQTQVGSMVKQGKSKDEVAKMLVSDFAWDPAGLPMRISLDGLMTEFKN